MAKSRLRSLRTVPNIKLGLYRRGRGRGHELGFYARKTEGYFRPRARSNRRGFPDQKNVRISFTDRAGSGHLPQWTKSSQI